MATSYKIRLKRFNGVDYDTLNLSSTGVIMNNGNTVEEEINNLIPSSNGIIKSNNGIFSVATLGSDYTAVDDTLLSSATKTYSIDKILTLTPTGLVSYAEAQSLSTTEQGRARGNIDAERKWTLLWTNASPTSDFAEQTVALDLSTYEDVKIDCLRVNTSPDIFSFFVKPGETAYMYTIGNLDFANAYVLTTMRRANVRTDGVYFENALRKYTNVQTIGTVVNTLLIPERIYAR